MDSSVVFFLMDSAMNCAPSFPILLFEISSEVTVEFDFKHFEMKCAPSFPISL
uniref:Uncharacterized protein n=1 Tax=Arcella intermedia TaxID=1963864 RepID=A0A6B2LUE1_9EUKA